MRTKIFIRQADQEIKKRADLDEDIPVAVIIERVRVHDLVLRDITTTLLIFRDQFFIWIPSLWILVQEFHVRVRWSRIEVVVELFDVLAMISLMTSHAK